MKIFIRKTRKLRVFTQSRAEEGELDEVSLKVCKSTIETSINSIAKNVLGQETNPTLPEKNAPPMGDDMRGIQAAVTSSMRLKGEKSMEKI